ncbi:hypothetical protein Syun_008132 [Stephania yunnanensis]|uniref:HECT-type E3 ubiquitin transferase n=1 Tax=Stephania yunnanensis TaxID=152371 RepID=A0AAP0L010_9MAGN
MFFSGDSSSRKRVDLGGRSSKERDRLKFLEEARLERKRRLGLRQQISAASTIQKWYRGKKDVEAERAKIREQFYLSYGNHCQKLDRDCFNTDSKFLSQLLFFFNAKNKDDMTVLVETCRYLRQFVQVHGDLASLFTCSKSSSNYSIIESRVKRLTFSCFLAIHENRVQLKDQLFLSSSFPHMPAIVLLETIVILSDPKLPWACKLINYLSQKHTYVLLRDIIQTRIQSVDIEDSKNKVSSLEQVVILIVSHVGKYQCICPNVDPQWSFPSQILTIPFLWRNFPFIKEVFVTQRLCEHYIDQIASCVRSHAVILPDDFSRGFPGYGCLLGNLLEIAGTSFSLPNCSFDMAIDFAAVVAFMLEALPPMRSKSRSEENAAISGDEMVTDEDVIQVAYMNDELEQQISGALNPRLLQQLVTVLFRGTSLLNNQDSVALQKKEVAAVGAVCTLLHVIFNTLPVERIMTGLAYRTELVPVLWNFMKQCHEKQHWPSLSDLTMPLPGDAPSWLLPLSVFCPIYKHMLMIVDNEEFYEQEKPLSLKDIRMLIVLLRQALWQLLWIFPSKPSTSVNSIVNVTSYKRLSFDTIQHKVSIATSELLMQLQDWNNRRQFTPHDDFHAQEAVDERFVSQAATENTRPYDILRQAPFLVPFTSRVKIFTSQLRAARQRHGVHVALTRNRFVIRRDRIFEDAFKHLSTMSEEDLRGSIRVTFVNEFGVEEAGIDGGGIFKDFMEGITKAAFDVQYGLFKETADHLLYPNPGSGLVHEHHLQFFHFLGTILGKAMFEGILVDIPFATFFLSKLKQKYNYLNDLPSLDPELYRHLIFLKHFEGNVSDLELYFVIVNNEYGEQTEEELLPGGKDIRVTNENVITYIHLIANHRLNFQIRHQSSHFLRGFQQLISKDWISMFNEHELQILISGSIEGMDVGDLCSNANYNGGYNAEHYIIKMFWEVIKSFSLDNQKKFLKFVTGCSRGPLLGFKYLEPQFCIQRAAGDASEEALDRLPTSATCMNLLKLPPYRSKEQMEQKLLYAINADAGFDLS